jgi:hypothetical protein
VDFRGHLRLPEDAGTGIPVLLRLDDIFVVISSGDDELGAWRADDVVIERIFSNQFAIELDGESMVFIAQDALGFAYEGISAIEDLQERLTKRRVFKRSKRKPKRVESAPEIEPGTDISQEVEVRDEAVAYAAEVPAEEPAEQPAEEPAEEPVLASEPKAIWSPPAASAPPIRTQAVPEPDFEVSVPEPVKRRIESETSDPRPDDVRVSYPQPSAPPPPAVESFAPPSTPAPEPDASEPTLPREAPVPEESVSAPSEEADSVVSSHAPEFEIEEVSAASTGATWDEDLPAGVEPDESEFEIEEYVLPSAGAADMFTAPAPQIEDEVEEAPSAQWTTPERPVEPEPDTTPPAVDWPDARTAPVVEGRHVADAETPTADTETPTAETTQRLPQPTPRLPQPTLSLPQPTFPQQTHLPMNRWCPMGTASPPRPIRARRSRPSGNVGIPCSVVPGTRKLLLLTTTNTVSQRRSVA